MLNTRYKTSCSAAFSKQFYSDMTFKHVLVPVWLVSYVYGRKSYQVLVNGHTGLIAGDRPYSFWKIFFLVLGIAAVVGLFLLIASAKQ